MSFVEKLLLLVREHQLGYASCTHPLRRERCRVGCFVANSVYYGSRPRFGDSRCGSVCMDTSPAKGLIFGATVPWCRNWVWARWRRTWAKGDDVEVEIELRSWNSFASYLEITGDHIYIYIYTHMCAHFVWALHECIYIYKKNTYIYTHIYIIVSTRVHQESVLRACLEAPTCLYSLSFPLWVSVRWGLFVYVLRFGPVWGALLCDGTQNTQNRHAFVHVCLHIQTYFWHVYIYICCEAT